jgi:hypothetical protein
MGSLEQQSSVPWYRQVSRCGCDSMHPALLLVTMVTGQWCCSFFFLVTGGADPHRLTTHATTR